LKYSHVLTFFFLLQEFVADAQSPKQCEACGCRASFHERLESPGAASTANSGSLENALVPGNRDAIEVAAQGPGGCDDKNLEPQKPTATKKKHGTEARNSPAAQGKAPKAWAAEAIKLVSTAPLLTGASGKEGGDSDRSKSMQQDPWLGMRLDVPPLAPDRKTFAQRAEMLGLVLDRDATREGTTTWGSNGNTEQGGAVTGLFGRIQEWSSMGWMNTEPGAKGKGKKARKAEQTAVFERISAWSGKTGGSVNLADGATGVSSLVCPPDVEHPGTWSSWGVVGGTWEGQQGGEKRAGERAPGGSVLTQKKPRKEPKGRVEAWVKAAATTWGGGLRLGEREAQLDGGTFEAGAPMDSREASGEPEGIERCAVNYEHLKEGKEAGGERPETRKVEVGENEKRTHEGTETGSDDGVTVTIPGGKKGVRKKGVGRASRKAAQTGVPWGGAMLRLPEPWKAPKPSKPLKVFGEGLLFARRTLGELLSEKVPLEKDLTFKEVELGDKHLLFLRTQLSADRPIDMLDARKTTRNVVAYLRLEDKRWASTRVPLGTVRVVLQRPLLLEERPVVAQWLEGQSLGTKVGELSRLYVLKHYRNGAVTVPLLAFVYTMILKPAGVSHLLISMEQGVAERYLLKHFQFLGFEYIEQIDGGEAELALDLGKAVGRLYGPWKFT
jgi:hypothetical protein